MNCKNVADSVHLESMAAGGKWWYGKWNDTRCVLWRVNMVIFNASTDRRAASMAIIHQKIRRESGMNNTTH